ncbi:MAG: GTP pyrophosphokinase, partial [Bacteroidota bacterium]|nr:GTP pyrophosphokinase [Bacteroidota bacterium]
NTLIIDDNADTKRITLAKCCNPIPGDEVAGFVNPNESIIIHKRICERLTNLAATQGDRIISVKWTSYKLQSFKAKIQIEGMDKLGMLNKITKVISLDSRVNIKTLSFNTDDEIFSGEIILYVHNLQDLEDIMKDLLKIDGVEKVTRLEE